MALANTKRLLGRSGVPKRLLPTIFRVLATWQLSDAQQMRLLGLSDGNILWNWKENPGNAEVSAELLVRSSCILGMYKSLHLLFPTQSNADRWLITANDNALFSGSTPIDLLMAGGLIDLSTVRDYLEAVRCER